MLLARCLQATALHTHTHAHNEVSFEIAFILLLDCTQKRKSFRFVLRDPSSFLFLGHSIHSIMVEYVKGRINLFSWFFFSLFISLSLHNLTIEIAFKLFAPAFHFTFTGDFNGCLNAHNGQMELRDSCMARGRKRNATGIQLESYSIFVDSEIRKSEFLFLRTLPIKLRDNIFCRPILLIGIWIPNCWPCLMNFSLSLSLSLSLSPSFPLCVCVYCKKKEPSLAVMP